MIVMCKIFFFFREPQWNDVFYNPPHSNCAAIAYSGILTIHS